MESAFTKYTDDDSGDLVVHLMLWSSLVMVGFVLGVFAMAWGTI